MLRAPGQMGVRIWAGRSTRPPAAGRGGVCACGGFERRRTGACGERGASCAGHQPAAPAAALGTPAPPALLWQRLAFPSPRSRLGAGRAPTVNSTRHVPRSLAASTSRMRRISSSSWGVGVWVWGVGVGVGVGVGDGPGAFCAASRGAGGWKRACGPRAAAHAPPPGPCPQAPAPGAAASRAASTPAGGGARAAGRTRRAPWPRRRRAAASQFPRGPAACVACRPPPPPSPPQ
jgi:hypothetical protein